MIRFIIEAHDSYYASELADHMAVAIDEGKIKTTKLPDGAQVILPGEIEWADDPISGGRTAVMDRKIVGFAHVRGTQIFAKTEQGYLLKRRSPEAFASFEKAQSAIEQALKVKP